MPDFNFFGISEHGLDKDQLCLLQPINFLPEFNCLAVSSNDNPDFFDSHHGHGSVALLWQVKFNDFITPIHIDSDCIVGVKFSPSKENTFHLLSVYLPTSSHPIVDFRDVLDLLWALTDTCLQDDPAFLLGDFNADLGDSVGSRGTYLVTARGKLLLEFIQNFNMSPVNLNSLVKDLLFTFQSENGEHQSVIDYIFVPNLYVYHTISSFTHEWTIDNSLDHVPVTMAFDSEVALPADVDPVQGFPLDVRHISWDKLNKSDTHERFTKPLTDLLNALDFSSLNPSALVCLLIGLIWRTCKDNLTVKHGCKKSDMRCKKNKQTCLFI